MVLGCRYWGVQLLGFVCSLGTVRFGLRVHIVGLVWCAGGRLGWHGVGDLFCEAPRILEKDAAAGARPSFFPPWDKRRVPVQRGQGKWRQIYQGATVKWAWGEPFLSRGIRGPCTPREPRLEVVAAEWVRSGHPSPGTPGICTQNLPFLTKRGEDFTK
jgi:hypothetical protein